MKVDDDVEAVVVSLEKVDGAQEILAVSGHLLFLHFRIGFDFLPGGVGSFFHLL